MLEILSRRPVAPARRPPLLFVHGICSGAWVWDEHMLPFFAEAGYDAHAVSLRGHGGSTGNVLTAVLADYVADLDAAVARIGGSPVVIGHSLGGAVVQRWVRDGGKPAGVALLASVPPWGLVPAAWSMAFADAALFRETVRLSLEGPARTDPAAMRRGLFSADLPDEDFARFVRRIRPESPLVGAELQGWPPFAPFPWTMPPLFVGGGADDRLIAADQVRLTGLSYGVAATIVPGLSHVLMLERRWRAMAEPLLAWLSGLAARREVAEHENERSLT